MIQLGRTEDGRLIIASNQPFPSKIQRVEYYREQKIFSLCFEGDDHEDMLMPYEAPDDIANIIQSSPDVIIVAMAEEGKEKFKYLSPLVQVGI